MPSFQVAFCYDLLPTAENTNNNWQIGRKKQDEEHDIRHWYTNTIAFHIQTILFRCLLQIAIHILSSDLAQTPRFSWCITKLILNINNWYMKKYIENYNDMTWTAARKHSTHLHDPAKNPSSSSHPLAHSERCGSQIRWRHHWVHPEAWR